MAVVTKISNQKVYDQIQMRLMDKATIAATVRDESALAEKGDESINFPTRLPRTATVVTVGSSFTLTNHTNGYESDILALSNIAADYALLDPHSEQENLFDGKVDAVNDMVDAIAVALDADLATKAIAAAQEAEDKRSADFYQDVINLRKAMRKAKIPFDGNVYLCLTADDEAVALKTKEFKSYSENGSGSTIKNGVIGEILGFKVVLPTLDASKGMTESFGYHGLGMVFAWHGQILIQSADVPNTLKQGLSVSRKFGAKAVQGGKLIYKWKPA